MQKYKEINHNSNVKQIYKHIIKNEQADHNIIGQSIRNQFEKIIHGKITLYHTVYQRITTSSIKYYTLQQEQMNMSIDGQTKDILRHHYVNIATNLKT